jgi:acetolactate synthase-1/3 small subunit
MAPPIARTFIVYVEDLPGVLNRVISLVRRRGYNIESLSVGRSDRPMLSRITLVLQADDDTARRMEANLYKLVNVLYVKDVTTVPSVVRELALIKVRADQTTRTEVLQLCEVFRAKAINVTPTSVAVEITGAQDKVDGLLEVLRPYGILEMVRTGGVAMTRAAEADDPLSGGTVWEEELTSPGAKAKPRPGKKEDDDLAA